MKPLEVHKIEQKTIDLKQLDRKITARYPTEPISEKDLTVIKPLAKKLFKGKIPRIYYYILEDCNYHSLNRLLDEGLHLFSLDKDGKEGITYKDYRASGGRTWQL